MADGRAYAGELGRTRRDVVHFTCPCGTMVAAEIYLGVDASADPELGARLRSPEPATALNTVRCPREGTALRVDVPVVYHDPARQLFALVLPESSRHRELTEHAALLGQLAGDPAPVPAYVRNAAVVFGAAGLAALIEEREERDGAAQARERASEREAELERVQEALEAQRAAVEARAAELERLARELERRGAELDAARTGQIRRAPEPGAAHDDPDVARWIASGRASCVFVDARGALRACAVATTAQAEMLGVAELDVRLQLHRVPSFALIVIALGTHQSLSGPAGAEPLAIPLELERDRAALTALARTFSFALEVYDDGHVLRRARQVTARLEENARWIAAQAESHLHSVPAAQRSFERALAAWCSPEHDRYGWRHPERSELREAKLTELESARGVRRALAIVSRFSSPRREEFLFMLRGYPIELWRSQRRAVLVRAVELGIWMGSRLVPIALEEGLARTHAELIMRMRERFAALCAGSEANDLDADAISDNRAALEAEAAALGLLAPTVGAPPRPPRPPRTTPIDSTADSAVSGTIHGATALRSPHHLPTEDLIDQLARDATCVDAAIELARRREVRAIAPIMAALARLPRIEAVRVLAVMPAFGDAATAALTGGLSSHKSFVRQGCALALATLRTESAIETLSDHILTEPTAVWRELARGMGMVGASAIMPLLSRLGQAQPGAHERITWALAHIAAGGARAPIETLARGRDPVAASVARHALELVTAARSDVLDVRGRHTPREQTVNRAFSRRFFQLLDRAAPQAAAAMDVEPADISHPAMVLDEADLLEAIDDDPAQLLDESDLIST